MGSDDNMEILSDIDITDDKITKALSSLKWNKSGGVDGINSTLLIECGSIMIHPLKHLFKISLLTEKFPMTGDWGS